MLRTFHNHFAAKLAHLRSAFATCLHPVHLLDRDVRRIEPKPARTEQLET